MCGYFREKVEIPQNKSYIILKGAGKRKTIVEWYDPDGPERSPTFSILADNIHVRCMSFRVRNFLPLADWFNFFFFWVIYLVFHCNLGLIFYFAIWFNVFYWLLWFFFSSYSILHWFFLLIVAVCRIFLRKFLYILMLFSNDNKSINKNEKLKLTKSSI